MHLIFTLAVLAATFSRTTASVQGAESSRCYTREAATRANHGISTEWHTSYTPCTVTSTKIIKTTVTPKSTVTKTVTKRTTLRTASTVSAPASFTPIRTSLPDSTYGVSGGADPVGKRDAIDKLALKRASSKSLELVPRVGHPKYPQAVSCSRWTHHNCATKVVVSTETLTETTSTRFKTVTTTTTKTKTSYTTTVYAACATNNFADAYNGKSFITVEGGFDTVSETTVNSAYECCVAAVVSPDGSVWAYDPSLSGSNCFIGGHLDGSCPNPATNTGVAITGPGGDLVIGNALCGEINTAIAEFIPSSSAVARRAAPTAY